MSFAIIDRRIQLIGSTEVSTTAFIRISDLRSEPFVVLLGEPGMGKSSVLEAEAQASGGVFMGVQDALIEMPACPEQYLFLDALDEYRSDGSAGDKIASLASALKGASIKGWRLSCRAEDWRSVGDRQALERSTGGLPIVVAQLLPLWHDEAAAILAAKGEVDPEAFLTRALREGAAGFIENPLSLCLLQKAISESGVWPATRFDLFEAAIRQLAQEHNPRHAEHRSRPPLAKILAMAGRLCLLSLVCGKSNLWLPNSTSPRDCLPLAEFDCDRDVLAQTLDTALFRGDGRIFEAAHRTVAEFLAADALAKMVAGIDGVAAFPLRRAMALITGPDGRAPTELRGLYAWFAAHLARKGDQPGARRLIELDAPSVLGYGDAGVFDLLGKRALIENLDRDDPWFISSDIRTTALGGLADERLAPFFAEILKQKEERPHLCMTILDALANGKPVLSMRPVLHNLVIDTTCPDWLRSRAADAWLNGAQDPGNERRALYDTISAQPLSFEREELRIQLAAELPEGLFNVDDLKGLLIDFARLPSDSLIGRLRPIESKLNERAWPEVFDEPLSRWLPAGHQQHEIDGFLTDLVITTIRQTEDLSGERLYRWLNNMEYHIPRYTENDVQKEISNWLDRREGHETELLLAVRSQSDDDDLRVRMEYIELTKRQPSARVIDKLIYDSSKESRQREKSMLALAVALAQYSTIPTEAFWKLYDFLAAREDHKDLLDELSFLKTGNRIDDLARQKKKQMKDDQSADREKEKSSADIRQQSGKIIAGDAIGILFHAAKIHRQSSADEADITPKAGRLSQKLAPDCIDIITEGWIQFALAEMPRLEPIELGRLQGYRKHEIIVLEGLDLLIDQPGFDPMSPALGAAIVVLKSAVFWMREKRAERLIRWAIARLDLDREAGARSLFNFWHGMIEGGAIRLKDLPSSATIAETAAWTGAFDLLMERHPGMPIEMLGDVLVAASTRLASSRLHTLVTTGMSAPDMLEPQRLLLSLAALALEPAVSHEALLQDHAQGRLEPLLSLDNGDHLVWQVMSAFPKAMNLRALTIRILGPNCQPFTRPRSGWRDPMRPRSELVAGAIDQLSSNLNSETAARLDELIACQDLSAWHDRLQHARAEHIRQRRDHDFRHPSSAEAQAALKGGPPVSPADLKAVVGEELDRLAREIRLSDTQSWKAYWNTDQHEKVSTPKVENICRNHLLDILRPRLERYRITASLPEVRRAHETRADIVVFSHAGKNLPIEIKREMHPEIWTAPAEQLAGYAREPGANGHGLYLVFWFGKGKLATHPDRLPKPTSAIQLEEMLRSYTKPIGLDLDIVVLDVSAPDS